MSVEQRVQICRLIEKMKFQQEYSEKVGIVNQSTFRGKYITLPSMKAEGKDFIGNH